MEYHGLSPMMGRWVSSLPVVPGMIPDHGQVEFVEQKSAAILKVGDASLIRQFVLVSHAALLS